MDSTDDSAGSTWVTGLSLGQFGKFSFDKHREFTGHWRNRDDSRI